MIYDIVQSLQEMTGRFGWLSFLRVFTYISFRAISAIILSFGLVILAGPPVIRMLIKQKIGDNPEFYNKTLNEITRHKANTPTMGGILISGAILVSTLLLADLSSFYIVMALVCLIWLTAVGLWDDFLKLRSVRRKSGTREGLHSWEKLLFQLGLAVVLGQFIHNYGINKFGEFADISAMSHSLTLPFHKSWVMGPDGWIPSPDLLVLGPIAFVTLTILVITGSSNAVNLTDGMDGLASGIMAIVAFAFMVLALLAGQEATAKFLLIPYIPGSEELAVVAGAMVGACIGFLWFNCSPAQVFMGDTGSLPLGGLIGYIAIVTRQEFMLLIIGGVFVFEACSVMMQVGYFKFSKGKRIFKCAPIHHHFHLSGWTETQVVVRFWVITAMLVALALATLKLR